MSKCDHMNFTASCSTMRLADVEDGPVTGYALDVQVRCADCGQAFRFDVHEAGTTADGLRMVVPMVPATFVNIAGQDEEAIKLAVEKRARKMAKHRTIQ